MRGRPAVAILAGAAVCAGALWGFQRPFREYPAQEYNDFPVPGDYQERTEFVWARLIHPDATRGFGRRGGGDWREGYTWWTNDYPRADRHLMVALRRLTRIHTRSVEQAVNAEDVDDLFDWPFLYSTSWNFALTDRQIVNLREYLLRGGFLICDDFWGADQWDTFASTMARLFPGQQFEDLANDDPVFHTVFDLDNRYQIAGQWSLRSGVPYLNGGTDPHWRGIRDDRGRLMVAAWFNSDTGDSWEWADAPEYPERYSALGIRLAVNHLVYAMTH